MRAGELEALLAREVVEELVQLHEEREAGHAGGVVLFLAVVRDGGGDAGFFRFGFLILLVLSGVNRFSLVKSNAIKVVVAFIYTISALSVFIINDQVNWHYFHTQGNSDTGSFLPNAAKTNNTKCFST